MSQKQKASPVPPLFRSFIDYTDEPRLAALTAAFRPLERAFDAFDQAISASQQAAGWMNEPDYHELQRRQSWLDAMHVRLLVAEKPLKVAEAAIIEPYETVASAVLWTNGFPDKLQLAVAVRNCLSVMTLSWCIRAAYSRYPEGLSLGDILDRQARRVSTYYKDRAGEGLRAQ